MTAVPFDGGFRVVCNRDERRSRPPALPARTHRLAERTAMWPVDPAGGGTWIGANDAGLVLCVLNRTPRPDRGGTGCGGAASRGALIPRLLERPCLDDVLEDVMAMAGDQFAPFTLVALQAGEVGVFTKIGSRRSLCRMVVSAPVLFTTSSLGDHLVDGPRRALFTDLVVRSSAPLAGQRMFHRHQWPDRPEISVRMSRPDAMTVSRTVVEVAGRSFSMRYFPLARS